MTSFSERLQQEFEARKGKNARYSLRAFATLLDANHATLAQVFHGTRRVPLARIRAWARRLGLDHEETQAYVADAHAPDDATLARQHQLRHWSAEALAVVTDRTHFEILRLLHIPGFSKDSRWVAQRVGISVDQVNIGLQRLLRLRLVSMQPGEEWRDLTEIRALTEKTFRRVALARVRKIAAEQNGPLVIRKD